MGGWKSTFIYRPKYSIYLEPEGEAAVTLSPWWWWEGGGATDVKVTPENPFMHVVVLNRVEKQGLPSIGLI